MIHDLVSDYDQLSALLQDLKQHLLNSQPALHIPVNDAEAALYPSSLLFAVDLLTDVWYRDGQDGRETRSRHGLIRADETSVDLIQQISAVNCIVLSKSFELIITLGQDFSSMVIQHFLDVVLNTTCRCDRCLTIVHDPEKVYCDGPAFGRAYGLVSFIGHFALRS